MYMMWSCSKEPTNEQIIVLFWIIRYKNIVYTKPCFVRDICQTFNELSRPQETIFVLREDNMIPVTEDLLVGKL